MKEELPEQSAAEEAAVEIPEAPVAAEEAAIEMPEALATAEETVVPEEAVLPEDRLRHL